MRHTAIALAVGLVACAGQQSAAPAPAPATTPTTARTSTADTTSRLASMEGGLSIPNADPFPSTYKPFPSRTTVIRNVTILTAAGPAIHGGSVLLRDGKIAAVGASVTAPGDAVVIDGTGKYVTPGIIDIHSHLGVYAAPGVEAPDRDGNEATNPVTANVWAEHSVWPQDPQFPRNLAGGVTTLQVLPGSANLIGGRSVVLKVVPRRTVQGMKFPGAKYGLKMACGENPEARVRQQRGPSTRMGNVAGYRAAWIEAEQYRRKWDKWNADHKGDPPARDLGLETLAEVLRGNILVHNHCYRADEMAQMIDIAHEFGYKIRVVPPRRGGVQDRRPAREGRHRRLGLGRLGRLQDGSARRRARQHGARSTRPASRTIVHSDDPSGSQRLNQEAAKAMAAGSRIGIPITEDEAIKWLTINPAWALDLDDEDRLARGREERRRRALVRRSVQRLHARREGVDRRRDAVRSARSVRAVAHRLRARLRAGQRGGSQVMRARCIAARSRSVAMSRRRDSLARRRSRSPAARSIR